MKTLRIIGFGIFFSVLSFKTLSAEVSQEQQLSIKAEIKQLVDAYAIYRDNLDADAYANLFAENGKFIFRGTVYQGRDVLKKRIDDANPATTSMHIMSSSLITVIDDKTATGVHYATVYSTTPEAPVKKGATIPVKGFAVMGKYNDKYELTKDGWKISERSMSPVFSTEQ